VMLGMLVVWHTVPYCMVRPKADFQGVPGKPKMTTTYINNQTVVRCPKAVLTNFLHTVEFVYSYVDLVCVVPLFYFILFLFPIATRLSCMNNHGI